MRRGEGDPAVDGSAGEFQKFGVLRSIERIWAVAAVRGDASKLIAVHQQIADAFQPRDGVVYLGDIIGFGDQVIATIDEILRFRRAVMAVPPLRFTDDFVILGAARRKCGAKFCSFSSRPIPAKSSIG